MSHRDYLFSLEQLGIKLGLEQIRALVEALGHPDRAFRSVIVAGTNGKGSVTAMVERALRASGIRTGRYTSPHLIRLNERFAVAGRDIADAALEDVAGKVRRVASALPHPPSFFEATTALALEWFRRERVEMAVLEVGLGGRLDATNVVDAVAAAITAVDLDHEALLGSTLAAIAAEKAGVIKGPIPVVLAPNPPEVEAVVAGACARTGATLWRADDCRATEIRRTGDGRVRMDLETPVRLYRDIVLGLRGRHQIANAMTAARLLEAIGTVSPVAIDEAAVRSGLEAAEWPGRLQRVSWRGHDVIVDGAHNPSGARALAAFLREVYGRPLPFVVGIMADKEIDAMLRALAEAAAAFVFTAPASPRAAAPSALAARATALAIDLPVSTAADPAAAIDDAARFGTPVVVAGSLYLAGEVLANLS